jgi:hypothetical protein
MPKVRGNAAQKWQTNAAQGAQYYEEGINNPRRSWQTSTIAAAKNQADGVQKAIQEKRFEKGVQKAGDTAWRDGAINKGVQRFAPGIQASAGKYENNITPFLNVIESTTLPPRYPKGDPRNIERVKAMSEALRKKKLSM